eukprot:CAMPEP_0185184178 /NCGR_PEP_ID=MMETSP1140-20130426/2422_1 /TAXON_ID=298111 /ORGANISM="Pavlova sp., Strain CCMP459" /LENGTH=142 /DNA_ID=CAMNT_0027750235 /DNA_START=558 /DNA_END=987 /DNA_ORIENTATION=+
MGSATTPATLGIPSAVVLGGICMIGLATTPPVKGGAMPPRGGRWASAAEDEPAPQACDSIGEGATRHRARVHMAGESAAGRVHREGNPVSPREAYTREASSRCQVAQLRGHRRLWQESGPRAVARSPREVAPGAFAGSLRPA